MKLSQLTFQMPLKPGIDYFCMHNDASDALTSIYTPEQLEDVKASFISRYGDVDITVNTNAPWNDVIHINDDAWREEHNSYCRRKAEWCQKYGCH